MMAEFEGKIALVTGGTRGIGKAIVRDLLAVGFDVCLTARSAGDVEEAATDLSNAEGGRVLGLAADVRDPEGCESVVARVVKEFGGLDLLVNNAGVGRFAPIQEMSLEDWQIQIDTNLSGVFYLSRAVLDLLRYPGNALPSRVELRPSQPPRKK